MAKKAKKQTKTRAEKTLPENALPQNILPVGERVEENKNIYIYQAVYKQIHQFTKGKTENESGGVLVGTVIEEFGKSNIVITGFVEAKYCEATPTTLKFTHETWEYVHSQIEKKHKGQKIVGWIHTHPDFGIFLSEYDKFIHQNFFSDEQQVAYVVDPIQGIEGFYFWINGNIEKCKGFYICDKTGVRITVALDKEDPETTPVASSVKNGLIVALSVAVALLILSNILSNSRIKQLEKEQKALHYQQQVLADSANQALYGMQQIIADQDEQIQMLQDVLVKEGLMEAPTEPAEEPAVTQSEEENQEAQE